MSTTLLGILVITATVALAKSDDDGKCCMKAIKNLMGCCTSMPEFASEQIRDACVKEMLAKGPAGCIMDCVFKNAGLYKADGSVDTAKVAAALKANSTGGWTAVVDPIVNNCSKGVAGVDFSKLPPKPPGAPDINFPTSMFGLCLKRGLYMSGLCNDSAANCKSGIAKLQSCDPFTLPPLDKMEKMLKRQ